jgi:hypothetical protein
VIVATRKEVKTAPFTDCYGQRHEANVEARHDTHFDDFVIYINPIHWQLFPFWEGFGDKYCDVKKILLGPLVIRWRWWTREWTPT